MIPRILLAREVPLPGSEHVFGGRHPIVVQTMTVAATEDTDRVYGEICNLAEAGAELVRLTVQSAKIAGSLEPLRAKLEAAGVAVPLAADIHFSPDAALRAADFVEKIRINPGNFADSREPRSEPYSDEEYAAELERIAERFTPLVVKCKRLGRIMRIGSNHGSLAGRVLSRYGDTPVGMVEAALEYARIAEAADYRDLVISMKASHVGVMVEAYRLLALRQLRRAEAGEGDVYPVHLGVTEAGEGEDGRLKSYIGMGSLLEMGIGDTVRVSLTEDAANELPAARVLSDRYSDRRGLAEPWDADTFALHLEAQDCDPDTCVINDDCFEDRRCRSLGGCDGDVCTTDACVDSVCQVARDPSCINTPLCDHDTDSDGICDGDDNCPDLANPDQADRDDNGLGDVCQESGDGETHLTDAGGASPDEGTADNCSTVSSASAAVPSGWVFLFCAAYLGLIRRRGESRPA